MKTDYQTQKVNYQHQNIFFISDLHLSHKNILKFDNRPFEDLQEMHVELIKNWNSVVGDEDIVYNLGDLSFGNDELSKWFLYSVKGRIHHIMGNHDRLKDIKKLDRIEKIYEYGTEITVEDELSDDRSGKSHIIMSHYPILSWNRAHHGSIHLHGHAHQNLFRNKDYIWYYKKRVMDVGCNGINYTPISYKQIMDIMKKKEITNNHH